MSNYIEPTGCTEADKTIQANLREACEHKIALHVDAAIDVVDTDPVEADAWAYEAGKEAWDFDFNAPEKMAPYPLLTAAFKRGFDSVELASSQLEVHRNVSISTKQSSQPAIESNVTVRLLDGVVVSGVVTGHGQKDGKPTFDFNYEHRTRDEQMIKAAKWAWPEQVQTEVHGNVANSIEQPTQSQDKVNALKNALGQDAAKPFYIWANDDCANKSDSFVEAKAIRLALFNEGGESVHIVDADGVEVVDTEIEAHEALAKTGYFVGARNPEVKPEFPGAFMVNDPQDPDGYAIVGDDIASLILEARDHLIEPVSEREVQGNVANYTDGQILGPSEHEMAAEYIELEVTLRSKTTFGTDKETIRVWDGQSAKDVAERTAQGYGAEVVEIRNPDGSIYEQAMKVEDSPSPGM